MKIKAIAALCKSSKSIILVKGKYDWVGNSTAIYPLFDMPELEMKNVCSMFDIPESQHGKFHLDVKDQFNPAFSEEDSVAGERPLTRISTISINTGEVYEVLDTSAGIRFLNVRYLTPFAGMEEIQLYERANEAGLHIAVKSGFILYGLIVPAAPDPDGCKTIFADIKRIAYLCHKFEVKEGIDHEED